MGVPPPKVSYYITNTYFVTIHGGRMADAILTIRGVAGLLRLDEKTA